MLPGAVGQLRGHEHVRTDAGRVVAAGRVVVAQRAAQREPLERPLVLREERVGVELLGHPSVTRVDDDAGRARPTEVVALLFERAELRPDELVAEMRVAAGRERRVHERVADVDARLRVVVRHPRVVGRVEQGLLDDGAVVADFEVVRAGDVGGRRIHPEVVRVDQLRARPGPDQVRVERPRREREGAAGAGVDPRRHGVTARGGPDSQTLWESPADFSTPGDSRCDCPVR